MEIVIGKSNIQPHGLSDLGTTYNQNKDSKKCVFLKLLLTLHIETETSVQVCYFFAPLPWCELKPFLFYPSVVSKRSCDELPTRLPKINNKLHFKRLLAVSKRNNTVGMPIAL